MQYGITSAGDNPTTGNSAVTGDNALIKSGVVFTFSGLPAGFDVNRIGNVWVQYGTALIEEPSYELTPEPATLGILLAGSLMFYRRRS
jgi:hypothetical protein